MNHQDLKTTIEELNPDLTPEQRLSETVAALSQTEGNFKENVAAMEKLFTEKIGYKKEDNGSQAKMQRQHDSNMVRQSIAGAELELWFERTNHNRNNENTFKGKRYLGVLNMLYGNESEIEGIFTAPIEEQGAFYLKKLEEAQARFPRANAPDVSDTEIAQNFRTILELYNLTFDLDAAKPIIHALPNGKEVHAKFVELQDNMAVLVGRAFLMASPYYAELDYGQLMRTSMNLDLLESLTGPARDLDSIALSSDIQMIDTLQGHLTNCRKGSLEKILPKSGEGTVEYFSSNGKALKNGQKDTALGTGETLLIKVTGQDDTVSVRPFRPYSLFSSGMEELTPEQYLDATRSANRAEIADLGAMLEKTDSRFISSSDSFKKMRSAVERLHVTSTIPSTQNLLSNKDALEELLEAANSYLQFKAQSRAKADTVADYSKLGKNKYEQERINVALKLRDYAQSKLDVHKLLQQDSAFKARAAEKEAQLQNGEEDDPIKNIADLRATCAQRNQASWTVRQGGARVAQLHYAVGRDLRRLSEFACLDRPLDGAEKAEIRTRMARAVALDLIRCERAGAQSDKMGALERVAAQDPDKFVAGIAKSSPFLKMTDKMTPDNLKEMLSENGIRTIRQNMLSQAVSIAGKTKAPAKEMEAELPTVKNLPQA